MCRRFTECDGVSSARGAVLVHVAVAIIGLLAFSALSIDYGVMWVARRQAQNSADAAALAGATSLAFDGPTDYNKARAAAELFGEANPVFGVTPNITRGSGFSTDITQDISFPVCPSNAPGIPNTCVRTNVYRTSNTLSGGPKDPLPTFFGPLFGRTEQGARATATAQIRSGNASDCLKPWAVADRWTEHVKRVCNNGQPPPCNNGVWQANQTWDMNQTFDRFAKTGQGNTWELDTTIPTPTPGRDQYVPPTYDANGYPIAGTGSGFSLYNSNGSLKDYGLPLALKNGDSTSAISAGWFMLLDLPCTGPGCPTNLGCDKMRWEIGHCAGVAKGIGDTIDVKTGNCVGPTNQGLADLVGLDPNARWSVSTQSVVGSCAPGACPATGGAFYSKSPRIVPVALFDIQDYLSSNPSGSGGSVRISNIFGFFVLTTGEAQAMGLSAGDVYGIMIAVPGLVQGSSSAALSSSFLREIILVH